MVQFNFCTTQEKMSAESCVVVGVFQDGALTISSQHPLHAMVCETISQEKALHGSWKPKDETHVGQGHRIRYIGLDKNKKDLKSQRDWQECGASLAQNLQHKKNFFLILDDLEQEQARHMAIGARLSLQKHGYKSVPKSHGTEQITFVVRETLESQAEDVSLVEAILWARDMVNHPGNVITPPSFAKILQDFSDYGLDVKILKGADVHDWEALNGVAVGSVHAPHVVLLSWNGDRDAKQGPIALVGKGVTFDSGGLSLKPAQSMEDMKMDKAGAVVVAATMRFLAQSKQKVNVQAVLPLVENMPSGSAQRPGDIVQSLSGKTIEVLNTDAEGRLILADALWYAQKEYDPSVIVDVATLTGAVRVALGDAFAGLFSNDDELSQELVEAGQETGESVWRLPLHPSYTRAVKSPIADLKNITASGVGAGSSTAAAFLGCFIQKGMKWAHLDIAGVSYGAKSALCPTQATGFGVSLLCSWIMKHHRG